MKSEPQFTKSRARFIAGSVLFIVGLFWLVFFGNYMLNTFRHSTPDRLTVWLGIVIFGAFLFGFLYLISTEKLWKFALAFCYSLVMSIGMVIIPVPQGYAEVVLGGYYVLSLVPIYVYVKYRSRIAKKAKKLVRAEVPI